MTKYDSIQIGDVAEIIHLITQSDINEFVRLTGDDNKLHVNKEYAESTSFKKPVVHGMLGASFISTVIGTKLPGDGALWYSQNLEFLLPVRIGDKLRITANVIKKNDRTKSIELKTDIYNQHEKVVTTGTAKVRIVESNQQAITSQKSKHPKTALIVGGTGGIGSAACLQLAKDGFDVAIHYRNNKSKATRLKSELERYKVNSVIVSGEISSIEDVQLIKDQTQRALGDISTVVNCSTIPVSNTMFNELDWSQMQAHFDVNIKGTFNLVKSYLGSWESNNYGKYIGLTTLYTEQPKPELLGYITGKSALNGLIKALAVELAPRGIRMNLVSPGMVDTSLIADIPEKIRLLTAAKTPLRTLASAEDVAGAISFLASQKSNYLTGETIRVNGGNFML